MTNENHQSTEANFSPAAATAEMLLELGLMYSSGHAVERSYVMAHKWLNLAAMKGSTYAKSLRCELSRDMTAVEVAQAQAQARAWLTVH
jgi:uncharacterized protein